MGTPESRWALVLLHPLLLASAVLLAASSRGAAPTPKEPPKTPPQEAPPAWQDKLREKLREPVTIELRNAALHDACETLSKHAGVPILIDPELRDRSRTITLPKIEMSAQHWLLWICRLNRCSYVLRDAAVLIVAPPPPGKPQKRDYDIGGLMRSPFPPQGKEQEKAVDEAAGEGWCRYIRATIAPETWAGDHETVQRRAENFITWRNGHLLVVNLEAVQKEVAALLDAHRKMRNVQVHVLTRFLTIGLIQLDALKLSWLPGRGVSAPYATLTDKQVEALLKPLAEKGKGTLVFAPRLTCPNTQRAKIGVTRNHSYIRRIPEDSDPEAALLKSFALHVQPFISPDSKRITLVVEGDRRLRPEGPVVARIDAAVTVPDEGSVLFVVPGDKEPVVVLLTAEVVPDIFEE